MTMQNQAINPSTRPVGEPPSADEVRSQLKRILVNPELKSSQRRIDFLGFVVEETLAGRADKIKGFTIAVAVFDRDESFDAQSDPVVRLEARRLRRDLDSYYVGPGSHDPVRISIPKGSYVPSFEWSETAVLAAREGEPDLAGSEQALAGHGEGSRKNHYLIGLGSVLMLFLLAVSIAGWLGSGDEPLPPTSAAPLEPSVLVLPFEVLGTTEQSQYLASGLTHELIADLMRFPGFRLYTLPHGTNMDASPSAGLPAHEAGASYLIDGSVHDSGESVQVSVRLMRGDGEVLWVATYDRPLQPDEMVQLQHELAGAIATELGQPYGIVSNDLRLDQNATSVSNMQSYVCVLRAFEYRRAFIREEYESVRGCLEEAVQRDPQYSDAWAMLGWLHLDAGRYEFSPLDQLQAEYQQAFEAASLALSLEPDSTLALKALSSIEHYRGNFEESERLARQAVDLNPYDPDALAQLGWRLAVRGNYEEGVGYLQRAIDRTPNPPGWYFHLVAIHQYLSGEYPEMMDTAQRSAVDGSAVSQVLIAIASARLGRREEAADALVRMSQYQPLVRDPAAYLRRHGANDEVVEALIAGLAQAEEFVQQAG